MQLLLYDYKMVPYYEHYYSFYEHYYSFIIIIKLLHLIFLVTLSIYIL